MPESPLGQSGARPIGYQVTATYCRECAPEGVRDFHRPMTEGDGYGVPYYCDVCGEKLKPCEHEWSEWRSFVWGGEFRICDHGSCGITEHRDDDGKPIPRPPMPPIPPARPTREELFTDG